MGNSPRPSAPYLPFLLGPTARDTLREFMDIDVRVDDLARILRANKPYLRFFREFVSLKVGTDGQEAGTGEPVRPPNTRRLVGLLGMVGTRNLILALRMSETVKGRLPAGSDPAFKASAWLKHAAQADDFFQRNHLGYPETAFAAGSLYDWMQLALKESTYPAPLDQFFQETWKYAFRAGVAAFAIAEAVPGQLPARNFAAAVAAPAGKIMLAAGDFGYADFLRAERAHPKLDTASRLLRERDRWGTSFEEESARLVHFFSIFAEHAPVIRRAREPYLLAGYGPAREAEGHILALALAAAELRAPATEKDLDRLSPRSLAALGLSGAKLLHALGRAATYR